MKKNKYNLVHNLIGEKESIFTPQRQSKAAIIIILLKFIKVLARQLWPIILVILFNRKGNLDIWLGMIVAVISLTTLTGSIIAYFKFYYFVEGGELNVRKGVLKKTSLNVPFERIQSVDFEQNIIHQLFNVVSVKIDTAGSAGSELSIDAISRERADELRDYILKQRKAIKEEQDEEGVIEDEAFDKEAANNLILALTPIDLLKVGVSQNHLRTALIILAFFFTIGGELESIWNIDLVDEIENRSGDIGQVGIIFAFLFATVFIFISFLITLVRTVINYFNLKFWETPNGFKVVSGLITRKEKSMQKKKLQILGWSNNPIKKLFGIYQLRLFQAASMDVLGQKTMIVPGAYQNQIEETMHIVIPGTEHAIFERHGIHPLARLRFIWFLGMVPCIAISIVAWVSGNQNLYWLLLYLPLSVYMGFQYFKKRGFQIHPDYFIAEGGIFGRSFKLIEMFKIQAVQISQGWYETRKNLATIHIYTAAGDLSVPYLPMAKANQLKDYILFKVEGSKEEWM